MYWLQVIINHLKQILEFEIDIFESKKLRKTVLSKKAGEKLQLLKKWVFSVLLRPNIFNTYI